MHVISIKIDEGNMCSPQAGANVVQVPPEEECAVVAYLRGKNLNGNFHVAPSGLGGFP